MYLVAYDESTTRDAQDFLFDTMTWYAPAKSTAGSTAVDCTDMASFRNDLIRIRPQLVHYIGNNVTVINQLCNSLNITLLSGVFTLSSDPSYKYAYAVSESVAIGDMVVWHPVSTLKPLRNANSAVHLTIFNVDDDTAPTVINLLIRLQHVPFYIAGIKESCREQVENIITSRPHGSATCIVDGDVTGAILSENYAEILGKTRILLILKETAIFSRLASHAIATRTPTIAVDSIGLSALLNNVAIILPRGTSDDVIYERIKGLDEAAILFLKGRMTERHAEYTVDAAKQTFAKLLVSSNKSKARMLIFTMWGDEGVGVQARNYLKFFIDIGVEVCIFSYRSEWCHEKQRRFQTVPGEWTFPGVPVYYSEYDKSNITKYEILAWAQKNNSHHVLFVGDATPHFEAIEMLRDKGMRVYTAGAASVKADANLLDLGYSIHGATPLGDKPKIDQTFGLPLKLLCIGGANKNDRKRTALLCRSVNEMLHMYGPVVSLTVTQFGVVDLSQYSKTAGIKVINRPLSRVEIRDLFAEHHVLVCLSQYEVLPTEIYEALSTGTSVLTLDAPPCNTLVEDGVSGWLMPCSESHEGYSFRLIDLINALTRVKETYDDEYGARGEICYKRKYSAREFKRRLSKLIYMYG